MLHGFGCMGLACKILKSWDFAEDFRISREISKFHVRFQDFQISMKSSARFPDFNEDFCRFTDSSADFDIPVLNFRMI